MTSCLRHYLSDDCGDLEYNDDSTVEMSQTPHDAAAPHVTTRRLESLGRQDLDIAHFVHRQSDVLVTEFRQDDRPVVSRGGAGEAGHEIDHRYDRAAQVEQAAHVGWRAGQSRGTPERNDLTNGAYVAAIHRAGDREQQQSLRACR